MRYGLSVCSDSVMLLICYVDELGTKRTENIFNKSDVRLARTMLDYYLSDGSKQE